MRFSPLGAARRAAAVAALVDELCPMASAATREVAVAVAYSRNLSGLCVGNIAAVRRRAATAPPTVVDELVAMLARVVKLKERPCTVGFDAHA